MLQKGVHYLDKVNTKAESADNLVDLQQLLFHAFFVVFGGLCSADSRATTNAEVECDVRLTARAEVWLVHDLGGGLGDVFHFRFN